ncbi:hypothetical protein [Nocardioides bigeumensis]
MTASSGPRSLFHRMAEQVPAYATFLLTKENHVQRWVSSGRRTT